MIDKAYLRGTQTKNTKCYLSVRDIQKNIYHENCIQNKFKREKYVYYKYGSLKSYQNIIDTVSYREKYSNTILVY